MLEVYNNFVKYVEKYKFVGWGIVWVFLVDFVCLF